MLSVCYAIEISIHMFAIFTMATNFNYSRFARIGNQKLSQQVRHHGSRLVETVPSSLCDEHNTAQYLPLPI